MRDFSYIRPSMRPPEIPGYTFVNNNIMSTGDEVIADFKGVIPENAFLTLASVIPGASSTTFVEDKIRIHH